MSPDEILTRQKAQIDQIIDSFILNPFCEEDYFQSLFTQLVDVELLYAEGLRRKLEQMKQEKKVFGVMADAYEHSIDEMLSRHEALYVIFGQFRERHRIARPQEASYDIGG